MEISVIRAGNLPLHGTKLFVSIARILSRGESIIRHPTTPAALQPKPIHKDREIWYAKIGTAVVLVMYL